MNKGFTINNRAAHYYTNNSIIQAAIVDIRDHSSGTTTFDRERNLAKKEIELKEIDLAIA
jgi:hypothetical protein